MRGEGMMHIRGMQALPLMLVAVLAGGCGDSGAPGKSAAASPDQLYHRGVEELRRGCFDAAVEAFRATAKLSPTNHSALGFEGQALLYANRFDEAIAALTRALELNPYSIQYRVDRARALRAKGDAPAAYADLDAAIGRASSSGRNAPASVLIARALILEQDGRVADAMADYDTILKHEPKNVDVMLIKAQALARVQQLDAALTAYDAAVQANPKRVQSYDERSALLERMGRKDAAAKDRSTADALRKAEPPAAKSKPVKCEVRK